MRRTSWVAAAAAALLMSGVAGAPRAQDDDVNSCRQACFEDEELCYESCDAEADPVACEEACQQALDACIETCG
ncbi:MAG: hypothetical protein OEM49_08180 [Myxococcales bacterium]|nr:hypothetical protein [Myxococcales bacterium]MDH5306961.1 hypothetical protein [Myxococcales bacterium]MDH5566149.1 hypothetical protein [Myxococcales bacterium]